MPKRAVAGEPSDYCKAWGTALFFKPGTAEDLSTEATKDKFIKLCFEIMDTVRV